MGVSGAAAPPESSSAKGDEEFGGEDFAFFSQRVPSLMFRLGVRNDARGIVHGVHSSRFDLDEDALPIGTAALAQVTMDYVQKGG